jgi:hypothetical protein
METGYKNDLFSELRIDFTAQQYLRAMARWALVIVVVAFISYVLSVIQLITAPEITTTRSEGFDFGMNMTEGGGEKIWSIAYIVVMAILQIFLYLFATQVRTGLNGLNQASLNKGLRNLKSYFMMASILCIVIFLFIIGLIVFLVSASPQV